VRGRVAVVTGAASGIGRATARALHARGAALALCDLDAPALERVALELGGGPRVLALAADVTREDQVERFAEATRGELGVPDLLVAAAGVLVLGSFAATPLEDWEHALDVNLKGPVRLCRACLPGMVARGRGHVVTVASAAAFATQSELTAYGATKHALLGLSQALMDELEPSGVGVSVVCPGFVDTPILERARVRGDDPEGLRRKAAELLRRRRLPPERVADSIVRAAERGIPLVTVGLEAQALQLFERALPGRAAVLFRLVRGRRPRT